MQRIRGTTFVHHGVKSIVNSPDSTGMEFWSVNPYVGCEIGCTYCYARYAHRYVVERTYDGPPESAQPYRENFERHIFVKQRQSITNVLDRDLLRVLRKHKAGKSYPIIIGTATDPYQPAERRFQITRLILEKFLDLRNLKLGIITKSSLVTRDIDTLLELQSRHELTIYVSLISTSVRIIKLFEARSPMPHARLRALHRLRKAGIKAGIIAAPVLPGITDSVLQVDALVAAAQKADAVFVHPSVLRIYPSVNDRFLPVIEQYFPNLLPRYRAAYQGKRNPPTDYVVAVERRFQRVARKYGMAIRDPLHSDRAKTVECDIQLRLL
ncbi:MAG: radical SAM protein [Gemmatimonadales bacterium]